MGRAHDENPTALAVLGLLCLLLLVLGLLGGGGWWMYRQRLAAEAAMVEAQQAEEAQRDAAFRALVEGHALASRAAVPQPEEPAPGSRSAPAAESVPVSGRVVDTDGTPQAGVRVRFVQPARRPGTTVESGPDGGFTLPTPLSTGEWLVLIDMDRQLVRPQAFTLGPQPEAFVEVVVAQDDPKQQIHGRVADPSGRPVARAVVAAVVESGGAMSSAWTRPDGTFVLRRQRGSGTETGTRLCVAAPGFADHADGTMHPWGTRDLLLTLQRGIDVPIRVVVAGSGEPVEQFKMSVVPADAPWSGPDIRPLDGRFPGGLATFTASARGSYRALVQPEDRTLGLSDWVEFTAGDAPAPPVIIEVPRVVPVRVTVVTSQGAPVAGSRIEVVRQGHPDFWRIDTWAGTLAQGRGGMMLREQFVWLLAQGVTDAEGKATLTAAPSKLPLGVRALGPGHVPAFVEPLALGAGGADVPIVVEHGATLTGTLIPAAVLAALERFAPAGSPTSRTPPGLRLLRTGDGAVRALPMAGRFTPEVDGQFRCTGIPAGTWTLQLSWDVVCPDQTLGLTHANATLDVVRELRNGETRELSCDLSALMPASLRGQVFVDGQPFALGRVTLWSWNAAVGLRSRSDLYVRTDGEGRFQVAALRPGAYRLVVDIRDQVTGRELQVQGREVLTLAPGQAAEHTFQIERLRARLRLLSAADERPLPNHQVSLRDADGSWAQELVTDAEGQLVLDPVRPGPIAVTALRVGVSAEERRTAGPFAVAALLAELGTIEVPPGQAEATFTLRVPGRQ